ncbi:unnamed protein product [Trichogramma brassicae]|uniref:Methyltransferase domain-containing protein n=1 Tax=Trichogramma brassicae TaxID=86971 RepID=A0A6H5IME0_9HYME|nr:unnamed protein product [Trichogramma brassicae]
MNNFKVARLLNASCRFYCTEIQKVKPPHIPVMANETLKYLKPSPGDTIIDMTFGAGGHTKKILEAVPDVKIFALDRDITAIKYAEELASQYPNQIIPLHGKFSDLPQLLKPHKIKKYSIDGILFDFGVSSMQFDTPSRGFMLSKDGPLDMRMDKLSNEPTAADVLERADERDLYHILKYYGEEKRARKIARAIVEARYCFRSLKTTHELAKFIDALYPSEGSHDGLGRFQHSATKTFQALRIFVNNELNEINHGIVIADKLLKINGRLVTISFHSLEDTIVKRHLSGNLTGTVANQLPLRYSNPGIVFESKEVIENLTQSPWLMLHKHVLLPTDEEIYENPRCRSAKMRALVKIK